MSTASSQSITQLFQDANDQGDLSDQSMRVLQVVDLGAQIQDALGGNVSDFGHSEVVLVSQLIDDSGSIRMVSGNCEAVRTGHNLVLDSLLGTKQRENILAMTKYLNGYQLFPYLSLAQALKMNAQNYNPQGMTPLYDEAIVMLGAVLAKALDFASNGISARTVTLITSDGADTSSRHQAKDVKHLVSDTLRQENHIVAGMGIDDGNTDFRQVYSEMGIPDEWILTPGNSPSEIRKAFGTFSQSAVRASQGGASFSQVALGGFGAP